MSPLDSPLFSRKLLEAAPDPIIVIDEAGVICLVNEQTTKLFGYARDVLLGQPIELLMPARFRHGRRGSAAAGPP